MTQSNSTLSNIELTEFVRVHNAAIAHHQQWLTDHQTAITQHDTQMARISSTLAATAAQQEINTQEIASLTAGITDLRSMVADYIQSRSQT